MEGSMETNQYASSKRSINTIKSNKSPIQFENPWRLQLEVVSQERTRKSWSFCFNSLRAWEPPDNTSNSIHSQPTLLQQNFDTFLQFIASRILQICQSFIWSSLLHINLVDVAKYSWGWQRGSRDTCAFQFVMLLLEVVHSRTHLVERLWNDTKFWRNSSANLVGSCNGPVGGKSQFGAHKVTRSWQTRKNLPTPPLPREPSNSPCTSSSLFFKIIKNDSTTNPSWTIIQSSCLVFAFNVHFMMLKAFSLAGRTRSMKGV